MLSTAATTRSFCEYFADPYDIRTSFQLSDRLRHGDSLESINRIRDADAALASKSYAKFLRLIQPVVAFLPASQRRQIISRIVYNDLYLRPLEPSIFTVPAREHDGRFTFQGRASHHRELDLNFLKLGKSVLKDTKKKFHELYGWDLSQSVFSIRHTRAVNSDADFTADLEADPRFKETNENYLHLDQKKGVTTIVYLSDVAVANGAFRYVDGSHQAKISPTLKAFHEFTYADAQILTEEGLQQLPPEFRSGINYYYWLESDKQRIIDTFTRTLVGPAGTAITFAGNAMLHGGGVPYSGERSALFIQHFGRASQRLRQVLHPISLRGRWALPRTQ